jgi:F0F1-type ATP synthase membrane subunit b/b'
MSVNWGVLAPIATVVISAVLGVLGYVRANKSDQVTSYRDLLKDYREEVDRLRAEVESLITSHRQTLEQARADHDLDIGHVRDELRVSLDNAKRREAELLSSLAHQAAEIRVLNERLRAEGVPEPGPTFPPPPRIPPGGVPPDEGAPPA